MKKLTKNTDAFGMEMMAYYNDGDAAEIIERGDGYIDVSDRGIKTYFYQYKDWSEIDKKAIKYIKGKTLDLGCGAGRVSIYLQNKKIDCLGIDNSPLAVKVCKMRGVKNVKVLPVEEISKLKDREFQGVTMLGNNFGLLANPRKAKKILKELYKITTDNAVILGQTCDISDTQNPYHLKYQRELIKKGKLPGELKLRCRYKNIIGPWFEYLMVTPKQMEKILIGTGWKIRKLIKNSKSPLYCAIIVKN